MLITSVISLSTFLLDFYVAVVGRTPLSFPCHDEQVIVDGFVVLKLLLISKRGLNCQCYFVSFTQKSSAVCIVSSSRWRPWKGYESLMVRLEALLELYCSWLILIMLCHPYIHLYLLDTGFLNIALVDYFTDCSDHIVLYTLTLNN